MLGNQTPVMKVGQLFFAKLQRDNLPPASFCYNTAPLKLKRQLQIVMFKKLKHYQRFSRTSVTQPADLRKKIFSLGFLSTCSGFSPTPGSAQAEQLRTSAFLLLIKHTRLTLQRFKESGRGAQNKNKQNKNPKARCGAGRLGFLSCNCRSGFQWIEFNFAPQVLPIFMGWGKVCILLGGASIPGSNPKWKIHVSLTKT